MKTLSSCISSQLRLALLGILLFCATLSFAEDGIPLPIASVAGQTDVIHFKDFAGKVLLIDFWASWCGPCRQSFPWMNDMQAKYKAQGFEVIAINLDSDPEAAQNFLKEVPATFLLGFDGNGDTAEKMQVEAMPMSYLIDRQGKIRHRLMGFNSTKKSEHEGLIQTLLSEAR